MLKRYFEKQQLLRRRGRRENNVEMDLGKLAVNYP
jgi:hypothetical protein